MLNEEALIYEEAIQGFTWGFQQNVFTFIENLKVQGYTIDDFKAYRNWKMLTLASEAEAIRLKIKADHNAFDCTECRALMFAYPINDKPETQIDDSTLHSVWICQNKNCLHTIYNKETVEELKARGN